MPNYRVAVPICVLLLLTLVMHESASAQSEEMEKKIEVGAQISALAGRIGGGGRVTYNLTKFLALEGELNYLSSNRSDNISKFQGQFGIKTGLRFNKFGIFGKVRPGFINTRQDVFILLPTPCIPAPGTVCVQSVFPLSFSDSYTGFSLDVGGVAELYPSKRIVVRLDIGDTIHNQRSPFFFGLTRFATHNSQLSVGLGYRF